MQYVCSVINFGGMGFCPPSVLSRLICLKIFLRTHLDKYMCTIFHWSMVILCKILDICDSVSAGH